MTNTSTGLHPDANAAVDPIIQLVQVHKSFGRLAVLRDINLKFERGCSTVVIGPSAVGKSVLLKHIVGLTQPDQGEIWFENQRIDQLDEPNLIGMRQQIGFLFQMGGLFDSMSVQDNICFPLVEHTKTTKKQRDERCMQSLRMVGLSDIVHKMPAELSGGQRKRVALARAIVLEPKVVLYDEPTTGLDPIRADLINELIVTLGQQLGITSIVVTHDISSANKIADRIVMLYDGRIVADGDSDVFTKNESDLVQRFIHGRADQRDLDWIHRAFGPTNQH